MIPEQGLATAHWGCGLPKWGILCCLPHPFCPVASPSGGSEKKCIDARKHSYLSVAVCDQHIVRLIQASRPSTELLLGQLGEGQGGGGGDEHDEEGGGGDHLDPGDLAQSNYGLPGAGCISRLRSTVMQSGSEEE